MQFGVMLNHQYRRDEDLLGRIEEGVQTTELLRDLGYDMLLSHHHFLANLVTPQALPVLAHLVPFSGRMRLGIGVYIATLEHPVALAEHFATLDQISGGRLIWGVGAGYREDEFDSFGIDLKTRQSRFYEAIEVVTALWSGEPVTHHGKHFQIEGQTVSVVPRQRPRPPIWIGANGPKTIVRAAAHGDAWLASPHLKFNWCNGNLAAFRAEQERLGVDTTGAEYPIVRELYIADTDERARAEVEPYIGTEYEAFSNYDPIYRDHYEEMWSKSFLIGSPQTVAERISRLAEAGWNAFVFRTDWAGMPVEMVRRTIVRFAEEVMPQFTAVGAAEA
ncbi:MAG TPA: LLM class flavin-dependent oxidoreductase [Solirubrobacteraceae bacterium]|nr:LLM class flavin-dependent oxidoreductase [Solirubrobacteraceae bacterium]